MQYLNLDPVAAAAERESSLKAIYKSIGLIESHLSNKKSKFLASNDHPTIADLLIIPELDQLSDKGFGLADIKQFPTVCNYINTIQSEVSSYDEVFQAVIDAKKQGYSK
jgi:glutathione S-transferase